jgi:DNA-binding NarL/FixJ family response regulator
MKRILLVDDHPIIVRGLQGVLEGAMQGSEFGIAVSPEDAVERVKGSHWDIAIVDLNLRSGR